MKTKKHQPATKLTGEEVVQQKLDRMNEMLKKVDLSKLPTKQAKQN